MENLSDCKQQDIDSKIRELVELVIKKYSEFNQYIDKKYNNNQLDKILIGLFKGLDISKYASPKFDEYQMLQIRYGLEEGLNVDAYANPEFSDEQMKKIRLQLLEEKKNKSQNKINDKVQLKDNKIELELNDKKVLISTNNDNSITIEIK